MRVFLYPDKDPVILHISRETQFNDNIIIYAQYIEIVLQLYIKVAA